ncbi:hypothetical protein K3495_g8248 [Podosphaera aphanis]|nr:hypothetical protein K3495_g8248 [Podosphaera aphanis]
MSSQPKKSSKKTKNVRPPTSLKRKRGDKVDDNKVDDAEVVVIDDVDPVHLEAHQKQSVRGEPSLNVGDRKRAQHPEAAADNFLEHRKKNKSTTRHTTTPRAKFNKTESTTKTESASSHVRTPLSGHLPETVEQEYPRASTPLNKITTVHRPKDEAKILQSIASDAFTRNLRSQKVSKFKSELSLFFPEYDEIIGNEPKQENTLGIKTPIAIVDTAKSTNCSSSAKKKDDDPLREYSDTLIENLKNAQFVDFSSFEEINEAEGSKDELCEEYFKSIHKQPERAEKIIRKTDKERAQHEKDQIIRLLDGLRGNDWLKILGVNSITENTKKEFQSAREYFISSCESILAKFRSWKEAEKQNMGP